jgi:tetratricopeptide (TPR) repeat protein
MVHHRVSFPAFLPFLIASAFWIGIAHGPAWGEEKDGFQTALEKELQARSIRETPDFQGKLKQGHLELRSRNYLEAARQFGLAYKSLREHPLPPFLVGIAYIGMEDYDKAAKFILWALQQWPGLPAARPDLPAWLMDTGEYRRLAGDLEKAFRSHPPATATASRNLFLAGLFLALGGDQKKAHQFLSAVPKDALERPAARLVLKSVRPPPTPASETKAEDLFQLGSRLFEDGRYAEAAHAMGAAVYQNPDDPVPYFEMGHALFAAGFFRHAARVLSLGIELFPRWCEVDMDRASFYGEGRQEDHENQMNRLRSRVNTHGDDGAALFLLGYNLYFSPARDASRAYFERAVEAGWSAPARAFLDRMSAKGSGNRPPPPPDEGPPPPEEKPEPESDPIEAGRRHLAEGKYDEASRAFSRGMADPGRGNESMIGLASAWLGKGDFGNAALWIRSAVRLNFEETVAASWGKGLGPAGTYEKRLGELSARVKTIHDQLDGGRSTKLDKKELQMMFLLGYCLFRKGDLSGAEREFLEIIKEVGDKNAEAVALYLRVKK